MNHKKRSKSRLVSRSSKRVSKPTSKPTSKPPSKPTSKAPSKPTSTPTSNQPSRPSGDIKRGDAARGPVEGKQKDFKAIIDECNKKRAIMERVSCKGKAFIEDRYEAGFRGIEKGVGSVLKSTVNEVYEKGNLLALDPLSFKLKLAGQAATEGLKFVASTVSSLNTML